MPGLNENVHDFPDRSATLAYDQYVIVPMVGASYTPLYVSSHNDLDEVCDALNAAIGTDMFVVECVTTCQGNLNWSMYRDADRMCWVDSKHGDV